MVSTSRILSTGRAILVPKLRLINLHWSSLLSKRGKKLPLIEDCSAGTLGLDGDSARLVSRKGKISPVYLGDLSQADSSLYYLYRQEISSYSCTFLYLQRACMLRDISVSLNACAHIK